MPSPMPNPGYVPTRSQVATALLYIFGGGTLLGLRYAIGKSSHRRDLEQARTKALAAYKKKKGH